MAIYPTTTGFKIKVMRNGFEFRDFVKGINNQQRAKEIEACAIADMIRGVRPRKGQIGEHGTSQTLQNLYDDARETVWKGVSVKYAIKLDQMWKDYKRYFEDKQGIFTLDRITTLEIDGFINWLETNPTRPNCNSTVNNKLCLIATWLATTIC